MSTARLWRWLFPELVHVGDAEARRVLEQTLAATWLSFFVPSSLPVLVGLLMPFGIIGISWLVGSFGASGAAALGIYMGGTVLTVLSLLVAFRLCRKRIRNKLRQALSKRGYPICETCGYNLTGNTSGTCPECGTDIEPAEPAGKPTDEP